MEDLAETFSVLDTHFRDVRTVLRMKLYKLPSLPNQEEEENRNIQSILNYWKTARNHNIEEYSEKLSSLHKKILIDEEIEDCKPFIEKIKKFQRTNLKFLHTNKQRSVAYNNLNRTEEFQTKFQRAQDMLENNMVIAVAVLEEIIMVLVVMASEVVFMVVVVVSEESLPGARDPNPSVNFVKNPMSLSGAL